MEITFVDSALHIPLITALATNKLNNLKDDTESLFDRESPLNYKTSQKNYSADVKSDPDSQSI